jgi:hypothetical protein
MPGFFSRSQQSDGQECCATATGTLVCCGGTAVTGWLWGTQIWNAMASGGVDFTGRVLTTIFVAGEFSVLGGVAAVVGVAAVAGLAYCCVKGCQSAVECARSADKTIQENAAARSGVTVNGEPEVTVTVARL